MRTLSSGLALSALVAVSLVAGSNGCATTPPTKFYTLSKVAGAAAAGSAASTKQSVLAVGPVSLPDYVDRPQIVVRESAYALRPAPDDQWGGALDAMVPRVLIDNLADRLPGHRIVPFPRVSGPNFDYRVAVHVTQFDVSNAGDAVVAASWQVYDRVGTKTVVVTDTTTRGHAASQSYEDRVAALSQALGDLSDEIARTVASLPQGATPMPRPH